MTNDRQLGLAGTVAGLGLAIGSIAFGAFLSQRRQGGDLPGEGRITQRNCDAAHMRAGGQGCDHAIQHRPPGDRRQAFVRHTCGPRYRVAGTTVRRQHQSGEPRCGGVRRGHRASSR